MTEFAPTRGRPKSEEKRQAILSAAAESFMTIGFTASMDQIAAKAEVSKQTLYSHFANKHDLFNAVVSSKLLAYFGDVNSLPRGETLRDELMDRGARVQNMMADPGVGAMMRCVVAQTDAMPEIAQQFWHSGPVDLCQHIRSTFARHGHTDQAETLAWRFVFALSGPAMFSNMLLQPYPITADRAHLSAVVDMFCSN